MFQKLIQAKILLVQYFEISDFDEDAIEYLIDTIDYLITGSIPISYEILNIFLNDVIVTSTYHKDKTLLKVASLIEEFIEELKCMK